MKIKYKVLLLMAAILSLGSCKKALDMAPAGKLNMNEIFTDNTKVGAFLNTCYATLQNETNGVGHYFWMRGPVDWCDDAWDTDAIGESWLTSGRLYNGDASAANHPASQWGDAANWSSFWNGIRNCNIFISRIDKATVNNESDRKRWNAEAHVLRAYYYGQLLKWFGASLPLETVPTNFTDDFSKIKKASYYEVVQTIMADCDFALATTELPWRITTGGEAGRVNKAMAEAIKSKMILFAASPLYNDGNDHWQEAYDINKKSLANLKAQGYELYNKVNFPQTYLSDVAFIGPDKDIHAALYNEYFNETMTYSSNPVDRETIYQSRDGQVYIWGIDGVGAQNGYKSGTCPSQELVDAYETIDGQLILNLANPYLNDQHTQPNYNLANTLYDPNNPYANRDPRFYASIYYNGSKRKGLWNFDEAPQSYENYPAPRGNRTRIIATYIGEPQTGISSSQRSSTPTGYFERKFLSPNSGDDNQLGSGNWKYFRLGEVILNFAEAAAEADQLAEATTAVNEIRTRAGMPNLPASLTKAELILRIHNERRVELAMEENRYFDVRRWSLPSGDLSKTDRWVTAMAITRLADGTFTYARRPVRTLQRECYTNKYLWVPIPLDEANRLKAITGSNWQNPGW